MVVRAGSTEFESILIGFGEGVRVSEKGGIMLAHKCLLTALIMGLCSFVYIMYRVQVNRKMVPETWCDVIATAMLVLMLFAALVSLIGIVWA